MIAKVISHAPIGLHGEIISVEADLRKGIPGIDIVGLPDNAVKEARERVRVAIQNSGFKFPAHRILVNLGPAGIRKIGAGYDLPIAVAILTASGQIDLSLIDRVVILGELNLSGEVKPVHGVLSAVNAGLKCGMETFIVPSLNVREAFILKKGRVIGASTLKQAVDALSNPLQFIEYNSFPLDNFTGNLTDSFNELGDLSDIKGHRALKRALEVAAAGRHHMFLFGTPGSGKTMAAKRLPTILPDLDHDDSFVVTQIHSIAGILSPETGLITKPPFRMPHHSATSEGVVGGGKNPRPGEVSLAHKGVLFLDEAPEFKRGLLQSLREPLEEGRITIVRANSTLWFPASFQLVMAANPCPCGNLGHEDKVCLCSTIEINNYWKRLGGALLDRIDIRVPLKPVPVEEITSDHVTPGNEIRLNVEKAVVIQKERYKGLSFDSNSTIPAGMLLKYCFLDKKTETTFHKAVKKLVLSSRACHSILKISRTIADLEASTNIKEDHLLEAIQHRRYGDSDFFWNFK